MIEVSRKVLCVDDQEEILKLLEQQLAGKYDVYFAHSGGEALRQVMTEGPFAVIVADYVMPGMDGVTLLREVHAQSPDTVAIMLTAHADVSVAVSALHEGQIFRFLRKPWDSSLLPRYVDDALEHYRVVATERNLSSALDQVNQRLYEKVQELEAAHRLLARWVQFSPTVLYTATADDGHYKYVYITANMANLTGISSADVLHNSALWAENVHPDDRQRWRDSLSAAPVDEKKTHVVEYRVHHQRGGYCWVRDTFRKIQGPSGKPQIIGSWIDVTEGKALEELNTMGKTTPAPSH
jgi:PAS domain S-box-containing protein